MANTKKRKKRIKRQILKRAKQTHVFFNIEEIEKLKVQLQTKAYQQRLNHLERKTAVYQERLDELYQGSIVPLKQFLNLRVGLPHRCNKCERSFWIKPGQLLKPQSHICGGNSAQIRHLQQLNQTRKVKGEQYNKAVTNKL